MNKTALSAAVALTLGTIGINAAHAVTLTFSNSTAEIDVTGKMTANTDTFRAGKELRMIDPTGLPGGGAPFQKDTVLGGESWTFDNDSGVMMSVGGTATTTGAASAYVYTDGGGGINISSASPDGALAIDAGADFLGDPFGFLAPTEGSAAGDLYGTGMITILDATSFEVFFPVLEAQWRGSFFTLGQQDGGGITMMGTINPDDSTFMLYGEELIDRSEDVGTVGFSNWTAQWMYVGTISDMKVEEVPIPAAVWLFGSGLLGLVGVARRRK